MPPNSNANAGRLIVTADDANITAGIDDAVGALFERGVITNIAAFMNMNHSLSLPLSDIPDANLSLHLNVTHGRPISDPATVPSLVDSKGKFHQPLSMVDKENVSLHDAIQRFRGEVVSSFDPFDLRNELVAQSQRFFDNCENGSMYNSFHQDLDLEDVVYSVIEKCSSIPPTRKHLSRSGEVSGYTYRLFGESATSEEILESVLAMLKLGLEKSKAYGGKPYEIILHPSQSVAGLGGFTAYRTQRAKEFQAWMSPEVMSFLSQGKRCGTIIEFE